jgi:hypothetical protein
MFSHARYSGEGRIRDQLVAVIFDDHLDRPPLACHVLDLRKLNNRRRVWMK